MSNPPIDPLKIANAQARAIAAVDDGSMSDVEIWVALNSSALAFVQMLSVERRKNASDVINLMARRPHV